MPRPRLAAACSFPPWWCSAGSLPGPLVPMQPFVPRCARLAAPGNPRASSRKVRDIRVHFQPIDSPSPLLPPLQIILVPGIMWRCSETNPSVSGVDSPCNTQWFVAIRSHHLEPGGFRSSGQDLCMQPAADRQPRGIKARRRRSGGEVWISASRKIHPRSVRRATRAASLIRVVPENMITEQFFPALDAGDGDETGGG